MGKCSACPPTTVDVMVQVAQLDAAAPQTNPAGHADPRMVDVIELMAAVLENSPSNRLTMLQSSGVLNLFSLLRQ